jgi:NADH dehydrogenase (ubiquinone) Fe-S protein 4
MASLRASSAARLLRSASRAPSVLPASQRFVSSVPTTSREEAPLDTPRHNDPNYEAQFDKATSYVPQMPHVT